MPLHILWRSSARSSASFSTRPRTPVTRIVHNFLLRLLKRQSPEFPCAFSLGLSFLPAVSLRGTSLAFRRFLCTLRCQKPLNVLLLLFTTLRIISLRFTGSVHFCQPFFLQHVRYMGPVPPHCASVPFTASVQTHLTIEYQNHKSTRAYRHLPTHCHRHFERASTCTRLHSVPASQRTAFVVQSKIRSHPPTTWTYCSLTSRAEKRWLGSLCLAAQTTSRSAQATQTTDRVSPYDLE